MRANTQHLFERRETDVRRATLPTNKSPICVRVLPHETPLPQGLNQPHSPLNIVHRSIIPDSHKKPKNRAGGGKTLSSFRSTGGASDLAKSVSLKSTKKAARPSPPADKLGYNTFYQS